MPAQDSWGGPIACEPPFAEALRNAEQDVTEAVYVYGDKEKPTPLFERIQRVAKTAFKFRKLLKNKSFDIIHLNTAFDIKTILRDSFSIFLMPTGKAKIFLKLHGSEADKLSKANLFVRYLINYLIKNVDGFGVLSSEEIENLVQLGFDRKKLFLVKNVITISTEKKSEFEKSDKDIFELLFISRFISTKGLLETIEACKLLKEQGFHFKVFCVGDGETREAAENKVKNYDLINNFVFTGYISESEVTKHLFERDIFVFPTRHAEGFPIALFKAVAVGMPIITTPIRAAKDYLTESENCLFCSPKPEEIADAIIKLIENKNLRIEMSENNLKLGKTLLPENIAEEFIEIYEELLGNNPIFNLKS